MANKINRDKDWVEAKRRCQLNQDDIRMAKELGMNPRSLIKNIPSKSQQWKAPVKYWIRDLYEKKQSRIEARAASKVQKPLAALPESGSGSRLKLFPTDNNFPGNDNLIPPDFDFLSDDDLMPADFDFLADDDPIPLDLDFLADDDSIPF